MRPTLHIKTSEQIDPSHAILLMIAGEWQISYALQNHFSKEIVEFGYYTAEQLDGGELVDFFEQNEIFAERYYQTAIAFNAADSMLIPAEFYMPESTQLQLNAIYGSTVGTNLITESLPEWNI